MMRICQLFCTFATTNWPKSQLLASQMLYLEIEMEQLRFFSLEGDNFQHSKYRMQPTLTFDRNLRKAIASLPEGASTEQAVRTLVPRRGCAMPLSEFSEEVSSSVYHACFANRKDDMVFYDMIPEANTVWVYGLPKEQCESLESIFGEVFYASIIPPLARYLLQRTSTGERKMLVNYRTDRIDLIAVQGTRLLVANSYPVVAVADSAYCVTSVFQRLQFDATTDECLLTGDPTLSRKLSEDLQRFIANVECVDRLEIKLLKYLH